MSNYLIHYEGEQTDISGNYLVHHGILGQKWGIRRYQNPDGTLTPAGRKHYNKAEYKQDKKDLWNSAGNVRRANTNNKATNEIVDKYRKSNNNDPLGVINSWNLKVKSQEELDDALNLYEKNQKKFLEKYGEKEMRKAEGLLRKIGENAVGESNRLLNEPARLERIKNIEVRSKLSPEEQKIFDHANDKYDYAEYDHKGIMFLGGETHHDPEKRAEFAKASVELSKKLTDKEINRLKDEVSTRLSKEDLMDNPKDSILKDLKFEAFSINDHEKGAYEAHFSNEKLYGGHSLDFEVGIDEKTKKLKLSKYWSMNG